MKTLNKILVVLCLALGGVLFFHLTQTPDPIQVIKYDTIKIKGDSVAYPVKVTVNVPVKLPGDTFWKTQPIDTFNILSQYFDKYLYTDTFKKDSDFVAILQDTITQNRIIGRKFWHQNLKESMIVTKTVTTTEPLPKIFIGGGIGLNNKIGLNISGTYIVNKSMAINGNIDPLNKYVSINYQYKIK